MNPAIKDELALRSFIVRTLQRLGLNLETVKPVGRPGGAGWRGRHEAHDGDRRPLKERITPQAIAAWQACDYLARKLL